MDLNANTARSSIEQTIQGFSSGASYKLILDYALHGGAKSASSAEVLINDQVVQTLSAGTNQKVPAYLTAETSFVAPANGIVKIGLRGVGSTSTGVVIDNLRLVTD